MILAAISRLQTVAVPGLQSKKPPPDEGCRKESRVATPICPSPTRQAPTPHRDWNTVARVRFYRGVSSSDRKFDFSMMRLILP